MERYEHIFNQVNAVISHCEPCMVSLAKVLLSKKEISPEDNIAFLILDKNLGRICFIDRGIPQFIREFFIASQSPLEEAQASMESLNLKIVNEVANSFDFYVRQFSSDRIGQMLISAEGYGQDLSVALEAELKIKIRKTAPIITAGEQSNNMETIYAMGACIDPPLATLSGINFLENKKTKSGFQVDFGEYVKQYKELIFISVMCGMLLLGMRIFFQVQLKVAQAKYSQLSLKEGAELNTPLASIQTDLSDTNDKLTAYKNIRTKSNVVLILLRIASHIPQGAKLKIVTIDYNQTDTNDNTAHVTFDLQGNVVGDDSNAQIVVVNQVYSDIKNDIELSQFVKTVNLVSLNSNDKSTDFVIHAI